MNNELTNAQRAEVLTQALPYIRRYHNKIIVVKYGGSAMESEELKRAVMGDIVLLQHIGIQVVLVHGGGPEISGMLTRVGKTTEFIDGLRVTDAETVEIVQMVLAGKISKELVKLIGNMGGKAIGLSGMDGGMIQAKKLDDRLGYVGDITNVNVEPILDVLERGYVPVISTLGFDTEGNTYNINADTAAAAIAGALQKASLPESRKVECLISMTDTPGILRDVSDPTSRIAQLNLAQVQELIKDGVISGGMIPKVDCCVDAIKDGVKKVFILDGRVPHSILTELLTDEGSGTMFIETE